MICPMCGAEQHKSECFLGALGFLSWFRCRYCGGQWSRGARARRAKKIVEQGKGG